MTKRKFPPVQVRGRRRKMISPYRRVEQELADCRNALVIAAEHYTEAVQALNDLFVYYDAGVPSGWTRADSLAIERIRKIAEGK